MLEAPDGGIYVGGNFSLCGNVSANNIARFEPGTQTWAALGDSQSNGVNGVVEAFALHDGALVVGGSFSKVMPGSPAELSAALARWDGATWRRLDGDSEVDLQRITSLLSSPQGLFVGGSFNVNPAQGEPFGNIARWTGARFEPIAPGADATANEVHAIALFEGEIHISGFLNGLTIEGHRPTGARRLARWSQGSWRVVGNAGGGALEGGTSLLALRLAVYEGALFLGGEFSTVDAGAAVPVSANNIARWDGNAWSPLSSGVNGRVIALQSTPQGLLVGGRFGTFNGGLQPKLARWTGSAWESLSPSALAGSASEVRTFAESSLGVLIGGRFGWANENSGPRVLNHVASLDAGTWAPLGAVDGNGANGPIYALQEHAGELFAAGDFTTIAGIAAGHVARHDGIGWQPLGPNGSGPNGTVYALASNGKDLFIGGAFSAIQQGTTSTDAPRLARWNGSSLAALGSEVSVDGVVRALLAEGSALIVGGQFSTVGANGSVSTANSIARFDGSTWSVFGSSASNGVQGEVFSVARWNDELIVGGRFPAVPDPNGAGGLIAGSIVRWNGSNWLPVGSEGGSGLRYGPAGLGLVPEVHVLLAQPDALYVGGLFHEANAGGAVPVAAYGLARWNGSEWRSVGGPAQGPLGYVHALYSDGARLVVGGLFSLTQTSPSQAIASPSLVLFERGRWSAAPVGIGNGHIAEAVFALSASSTGVTAAGRFGEAGGQPASHFSQLTLPLFRSGFEDGESLQP